MNRKGFTLIELLATIIILGIIMGITVIGLSGVFKTAKEKSEDVFVDTIKDAMNMYLNSSDVDKIDSWNLCDNKVRKTYGGVKMYKTTIYFDSVINSEFSPITEDDLVNPANEEVACRTASNISVDIYYDDDFVYYYSIDKDNFDCFKNTDSLISNLPVLDNGDYYTCN